MDSNDGDPEVRRLRLMASSQQRGRRRSSGPAQMSHWVFVVAIVLAVILIGAGGFLLGQAMAATMTPAGVTETPPG